MHDDKNKHDAESVSEMFEQIKARLKAEYEKIPSHGFKKGNRLWEYHPKYKRWSIVQVVDCSEKILLVRNIDFGGKSIPYRIEPEKFKDLRLLTKAEWKKFNKGKYLGKVTGLMQRVVFYLGRQIDLPHTRSPKTLKDYAGNWVAFVITLVARTHSWVYDPSPNTFKGLNAHGPLWKGQKIEQ